ncbi:MAG: HDIG domain-containing metalloprotein [Thermodesulfobacteriota bacterium]
MKIGKEIDAVTTRLSSVNFIPWAVLLGLTVIYIIIIHPNLVVPQDVDYQIGDVAPRDIKAVHDFLVEDEKATETVRQKAMDQILTVYDRDKLMASRIIQQVKQAFKGIQIEIEQQKKSQAEKSGNKTQDPSSASTGKPALSDTGLRLKETFESKIGTSISDNTFRTLEKEAFSSDITLYIAAILNKIFESGIVINKEMLLREGDKGIQLRNMDSGEEETVTQLKQFHSHDQAKALVTITGETILKDIPGSIKPAIVEICQKLIQPNITLNRHETEERRKKASLKIEPVLYKIKAGEMLLREGERVTETHLMRLKAIQGRSKKEIIMATSFGAAMMMLFFMIIIYMTHLVSRPEMRRHLHKNILFLAFVLVIFLFIGKVSTSLTDSLAKDNPFSISPTTLYYGTPLASAAMVVCLFLGFEIAFSFALILSILTAVMLQNRVDLFIYFFLSSTMGAHWIRSCRERKVFIKAGAKLGLLNVALVTAIDIYVGTISGTIMLWDWGFAFQAGVVSGMITAGLAPLIELAFDYTTDITLLEWANFDQPILRRLMLEAPGTYHHSVIVGSLVEAAASEIGANPLLAKVCGYYHDIGKLKHPFYFIENQTDGKNRHDKLAPSMSSLILIAHIKNGIEIAKNNKLGQEIIDTIKQHHGTSIISYFYDKARQQKGEDSVNIEDYRYPGPKPQNRESGLVMLADVVEAASRTLSNPTPSRIQGLVQNLINKIFSDGQLDDCELTLKDLHSIAKSFNKILSGIYHHRIEYPESPATRSEKGKNEGSDRQPVRTLSDVTEENTGSGPGRLRRLGLP